MRTAATALILLLWIYPGILLCLPGAFAQDAAPLTMSETLQTIERAIGLTSNESQSVAQRLSACEQRIFGRPQEGPLVGRIESLRQALSHLAVGSPLTEPASKGTGGSQNIAATGALRDQLSLMNVVRPNFLRIEAPGDPGDPSADYLAEVLKGSKGKVMRFKSMPVPVYINPFPDREFVAAVVRGFEAWEDTSGGAVRFVQVDESSQARIQVVWKRLGNAQDSSGCLLGAHTITKFTAKGKGSVSLLNVGLGVPVPVYIPKLGPKYKVPPQVIEVNLDLIMSKNQDVRYRVLQNIVTHELGHALGLLGHSSNVCDMMNPVTDEHSRLSVRDINTLTRLYRQKLDIPL